MTLNLKRDSSIQETKDTFQNFTVLPTGIYNCTIKAARVFTSSGGAHAIELIGHIPTLDKEVEYKEIFYITNRQGQVYYTNSQGKKNYLPGFDLMDKLCMIACGAPLNDLYGATEERALKVYNFEEGREVTEMVPVITPLQGKQVKLGILHVKENKQKRADDGSYYATSEVKNSNSANVVFDTEGFTYHERLNKAETPTAIGNWKNRYPTDYILDKTDTAKNSVSSADKGQGGTPPWNQSGNKDMGSESTSLFS